MSNTIDNTDDIIDSRDVIARIEELEADPESLDGDDVDELRALKALADQAEGYCEDWHHGATLIRDSYFKDYAMQFADDLGAIPSDATWPCNCIDWDQAARELQMDYTAVDFDGVTYWSREGPCGSAATSPEGLC